MAVEVRIVDLVKRFGQLHAVDHVTVTIAPGELFFLLGPSGCGKTTLLRSVAGFHAPDAGAIFIGDREVTHLPPHQRGTGMVFQSYALWPHMTVAENVAFGLKVRNRPRSEIKRRVAEALERVHMADRAQARPNQLSGGQQQRVALARALVIEPHCLLLDEPLSNLDAKLRLEMRVEIRRICKQAGLTAIYVTHDQKEALSIADRLAVMRAGKIEQIGTPQEVYRQPANAFVAGFIGEANFLAGRVAELSGGRVQVDTSVGRLEALLPAGAVAKGAEVTLCIRPEAVQFGSPSAQRENVLEGNLTQTVYQGEVAQHEIDIDVRNGDKPVAFRAVELGPALQGDASRGQRMRCWIPVEQVVVL
jgi:iron(III) transport system ATP-binding protein